MGHSFHIGHPSAGHYLSIQRMPRHELEGPHMDTTQQSYAQSDDENDPPETLVAEPTRAQSQVGSSDDEGKFLSFLAAETFSSISAGMEH